MQEHECNGFKRSLQLGSVVRSIGLKRERADWAIEIEENAFNEYSPTGRVLRRNVILVWAGAIGVFRGKAGLIELPRWK